MTEWIPPIAVLSEERDAILQLVRLCKRFQSRSKAMKASLELLAPRNLRFVEAVRVLSQELTVSSEREAEIEYREVESALLHGNEFAPALRVVLDRHRNNG